MALESRTFSKDGSGDEKTDKEKLLEALSTRVQTLFPEGVKPFNQCSQEEAIQAMHSIDNSLSSQEWDRLFDSGATNEEIMIAILDKANKVNS